MLLAPYLDIWLLEEIIAFNSVVVINWCLNAQQGPEFRRW